MANEKCPKCGTIRIILEENGDHVLENPTGEACRYCHKWVEEQFNEQQES